MSDRRVFVTGASGFVGNAIVPELVARGYRVRALRHKNDVPDGIDDVIDGSLANVGDLESTLDGVDAVVHAAALLDPIDDEKMADRINRQATLELARAAARRGVGRFVFVSTFAAVGAQPGAGLVATDAICRPTTIYGKSKLAAERELGALDAGAMKIVILRPPTVYGPGERRNFLALVRAIDSGYFVVPGSGNNRMSFCAARNLAAAVATSLERDELPKIVNVADEPVMRFRDSANAIARALGKKILPVPFPLPAARAVALGLELGFRAVKRAPPLSRARLTTLTADCALDTRDNARLGFVPVTTFEAALEATIREYRSAGLVGDR